MNRVAVITDIHANMAALEATLSELEALSVDAVYCGGDLVGYGPHPNDVCALIEARGIPTIYGNYDYSIGRDATRTSLGFTTTQGFASSTAEQSASPMTTIPAPLSRSSKRRTVRSWRRFGGSVTTQARWRARCGLWGYPKSSRRSSSRPPEIANRPRSQLRLHIFTISQPPTP
jgi:Calcineurin-like phosphoesterase superfamily domain